MKKISLKIKIIFGLALVLLFLIMLLFFSNFLNNKRFQKEFSNFQASAYVVQDIKVYEKDSLPRAIMSYLPIALNNKFNTQRVAEMSYIREVTDTDNNNRIFNGKCYFAIFQPGFINKEEESHFPLIWTENREFFITGNGSILEKFMSAKTNLYRKGADIDQEAFIKYIVSVPYYPWIFFNKSIFSYISHDSTSVNISATDNGLKFDAQLKFSNNRIIEMNSDYNLISDKNIRKHITVKYGKYTNINGNEVPESFEILLNRNGTTNNRIKYSIKEYKFY